MCILYNVLYYTIYILYNVLFLWAQEHTVLWTNALTYLKCQYDIDINSDSKLLEKTSKSCILILLIINAMQPL